MKRREDGRGDQMAGFAPVEDADEAERALRQFRAAARELDAFR